MAKRKTAYPIYIRTYEEAQKIHNSFSKKKEYLISIVGKYIWQHLPEKDQLGWPVDYSTLLHHAYRIRGVAKKILKSKATGRGRENSQPTIEQKVIEYPEPQKPTQSRQKTFF